MRVSRTVLLLGLVTAGVFAALLAFAADKGRAPADRYWTAPDLATYPLSSIALLPPATYDGSIEARKQVELAVGRALKGSGHRWVSSFFVRDQFAKVGGDSLTRALNEKLLRVPRLDSLDAPFLSRALRARGLLTVRVDQLERRELEANQSGRPSTTVQLRAALVDSTGRLLWTVHTSETLEGSYQDAGANIIGIKASGLNNSAIGGQSGAPAYQEVLSKVCQRWGESFPRRAASDTTRTGN